MFRGNDVGGTSGRISTGQHQGYSGGPTISLFNNAQHTNMSGQINAQIHVHGHTVLHILGEKSAMGATYNSLERQRLDAPKCHPNTRVAVMKRLMSWIKGEIDFDAFILWLYGAAGAGKSAIAHTLAEICQMDGLLLATFFFWKTAPERSNIDRFVATITYQIACAIPAIRQLIENVVDADPMIFQRSVGVQLAKLIIEPIRRLHSTGFDFKDSPSVIIIDGLDECQGKDIQSGLIKSLVAAFCDSPLHIRILIASRPEVYLQSTFSLSSLQPHLSRLPLSDEYAAEEDIWLFLRDSFDRIKREHPLASYIPSSWPSADVLHKITWKSSGQFIFASTTVKYVGGDPYELPTRRLDVIRHLQPPRGEEDLPYAELNSLYHHVLSDVRDTERVKDVLGVLIIARLVMRPFRSFDTTQSIDDFFLWNPGETKACLSPLESMIGCGRWGRISFFHASLSDFLLDPSRSHQFYLCRESILSNCVALGLRHLRRQGIYHHDYSLYVDITLCCICAVSFCTPQIREELSQLSLLALYRAFEIRRFPENFWSLTSRVIEMLHDQNLSEQFPHFTTDLVTVCFEAFQKADPDKTVTLLVYETRYLHTLQVEAPNLASPFPLHDVKQQIRGVIKRIVTLHPQRHRLEFTGLHYALVASNSLDRTQYVNSNLFQSADAFHTADDLSKKDHSSIISALLYIAHALPLACKSEKIMRSIVFGYHWDLGCAYSFHERWPLDGWNDDSIQPARDAVLNYYKRYAELSDVEKYMRRNNLS